MKTLLLTLAAIAVLTTGRGQSFEGTLTWKVSVVITDEKALANIEATKKEVADPKTKLKLDSLKTMLKDPERRPMFESNPQLKQAIEGIIRVLEGATPADMIMKEVEVKIGQRNALTTIKGGVVDGTQILYMADKDSVYTISHGTHSYHGLRIDTSKVKPNRRVMQTGEPEVINGYKCKLNVMIMSDAKLNITYVKYWATDDVKTIDINTLANRHMGNAKTSFIYPEIGLPVKIEQQVPGVGIMTMLLDPVVQAKQPPTTFKLPTNYRRR